MILEVHPHEDKSKPDFFTTIGISDIYGATTSTPDVIQNELNKQKEALERGKQEIIARRDTLLASMETIRQHAKDWKIQKLDSERYSIAGFGLGWLDSKLTNGEWIFHTGTRQMTPVNREGISLVSLLIAN